MTDAAVHLAAQPRLDTLVTEYPDRIERLRTDYAGVAWIGDRPAPDSGMMGSQYHTRTFDAQLFLPDTHWYDVDGLEDVEVQVTAGVMQVPGTGPRSQGLIGAVAEPVVQFYEHPDGLDGVGLCLGLRGQIWSNLGVSYRVTVLSRPEAMLRVGEAVHFGEADDEVDEPAEP